MRKLSHEIKNFNKEVESIKEQNRNSRGQKYNKYNKNFTKQPWAVEKRINELKNRSAEIIYSKE